MAEDGRDQAAETEGGFEPITTQERLDEIVLERVEVALREAGPADLDELRASVAELGEQVAQGRASLEEMEDRAREAEAERDRLRHDIEVGAWRAEVAAGTGVPAEVLRGDTLEEVRAHAEAIRASMPVYPQVSESAGAGSQPMGRREILTIADARERKAAILANLDQF